MKKFAPTPLRLVNNRDAAVAIPGGDTGRGNTSTDAMVKV